MSARAIAVLVAAVLASGCAEFYRWPDRMNTKSPIRKSEAVPEGMYAIQPGDTLYSIAFRHQLDYRELAVWNDIGPDYLIHVGEIIRLRPPDVSPPGPRAPNASTSIVTVPLSRPTPTPEPPALPDNYKWRWPTQGKVIKDFGQGEGPGGKGIDIGGQLGQPVLAAAPGKVVYSGSALKGYGELIIIKHDDVHLSAYGYNRKRLVEEGTMVAAGQAIAELGVGPEQKPVLHFEVRKKGRPVDPADYLPAR